MSFILSQTMRVAGLLALCLGLSMAVPGPSLEEFLRSNGFGNVTERFLEEDITMAVVRNLTDDDLKEMGLRTIGRRRQFMTAARTLNVPEVVREVEGEEGREELGRFVGNIFIFKPMLERMVVK